MVAYERPALSKAYLFPESPARLPGFHTCVGGGGSVQKPEFYTEHGIHYLTGIRVGSVDLANKVLETATGDFISFGKLLIGTGARPTTLEDFKTPGFDLKGVHYLRNVQDADALVNAIAACKASTKRAICIGGGYIGMEVAAALAMNGLQVTMVFPEERLMERLFTPQLASFYENFYSSQGITLMKQDLVTALDGKDGKVTSAQLKSGATVEAGLVVVGVGARPNVDLFSGQLSLMESAPGGIIVNSQLQTSSKDVYAMGDVAAFPMGPTGSLVRQEHVTNARLTGAFAMRQLLNPSEEPYNYLPFFYSRVFHLSWQFYGFNTGNAFHFGDMIAGKFGAYWTSEDGHVVGVFLESGTKEENEAIKKLVLERPLYPAGMGEDGLLQFALSRM